MRRRLLGITSALSTLACLGVLASWVRSYRVYDQVACADTLAAHSCSWNAYPSAHQFTRWPPAAPEGAVGTVLTSLGKVSVSWNSYSAAPHRSAWGYGWRSDTNIIPSFSYFYAKTGDMVRAGSWTVIQASVRHWALATIFSVAPVVWVWKRRRSRVVESAA